jgi:uncharacterized protein (UPF0332 family)
MLSKGELQPHRTSRQELNGLRKIVARDLRDAQLQGLSADRRFATAYNAALQSAIMVLSCSGYRPSTSRGGHHRNVFEAMRHILDSSQHSRIDYFDACRRKRNTLDYDVAGVISDTEADELVEQAVEFLKDVEEWIAKNHPDLAG